VTARDALAAVADWTWEADPGGRLVALSAAAAAAFGVPPARVVGRPLCDGDRGPEARPGSWDNSPVDLPGGRYYLSATSIGADGLVSGIATRDPLPARHAAGSAERSMARRIEPTVSSLAALAERLAAGFADGDDRYAGYCTDLMSATDHLRSLVSERSSDGRGKVDLDVLAVRACGMVLIRAKDRGITLQAPAGQRLRAIADERATLQILANLLTNAIKYTPEGGRVGVDVCATDDGRVAAVVWDTGPGIPLLDQGRIFEDFERLEDSGDDGAGLGLGISQRLARSMGGEIKIDSSDGQGTRVTLLLPAA